MSSLATKKKKTHRPCISSRHSKRVAVHPNFNRYVNENGDESSQEISITKLVENFAGILLENTAEVYDGQATQITGKKEMHR